VLTTSVAIVVLWGRTVHCNGGATIARLESEGKTWWPHTCCTMLVRSDMNVAKVQAFVGHAANCAVVEPVNEALEVATPAPVPCAQQKVTQATLCVDCSHRRSFTLWPTLIDWSYTHQSEAYLVDGHLTIRRLKGSKVTVHQLVPHKGQPLLDEVKAVKLWLAERPTDCGDAVFPSNKGGCMSATQFYRIYRAIAEEAGFIRIA
jgi:hypothetical protein